MKKLLTQAEQVLELYPTLKEDLEMFFLCSYFYPPEINRASELLYGYICSQMESRS